MSKDNKDALALQMIDAVKPTSYLTTRYVVWHLQQALPLVELPEERLFIQDLIAAWNAGDCSFKDSDKLVGRGEVLHRAARLAHNESYLATPYDLRDEAYRQRPYAVEAAYGLAATLRGLACVRIWADREAKARSIRATVRGQRKRRECLRQARWLMQETDLMGSDYCLKVNFAVRSWAFTRAYKAALADATVIIGARTPYMDERSDELDFAHRVADGTSRHFSLLEMLARDDGEMLIRNGGLFDGNLDREHEDLMTAMQFGSMLPAPVKPVVAAPASSARPEATIAPAPATKPVKVRESLIRRGHGARGELKRERAAALKALEVLTIYECVPEFIELRENEILIRVKSGNRARTLDLIEKDGARVSDDERYISIDNVPVLLKEPLEAGFARNAE
jgi:hypothetical protein